MEVAQKQIKGMGLVTNSSMSCFKACRQKYFWSYEKGWRPEIEVEPLRIGSMVHEGLDMLAKELTVKQALGVISVKYAEKIIDIARLGLDEDTERKLNIECVTVCCLVEGYARAWAKSAITIIESEASFDLPIINSNGNLMTSFRQAGKRDRIGLLPDGRVALIETKTVGEDISPGSEYRNVLAIDQQVSMYVNAAIAEGQDIETTLYDCIRKPTIRPSQVAVLDRRGLKMVSSPTGSRVYKKNGEPRQTADKKLGHKLNTRPMKPEEWQQKLSSDIESRPEFYYQRFEVPRLGADLEEFNIELWMVAKDISECRLRKRWYRNTKNCRKFNRLCSYYPLCAGERDISNGAPAGFRQAETVHEEIIEKGAQENEN